MRETGRGLDSENRTRANGKALEVGARAAAREEDRA